MCNITADGIINSRKFTVMQFEQEQKNCSDSQLKRLKKIFFALKHCWSQWTWTTTYCDATKALTNGCRQNRDIPYLDIAALQCKSEAGLVIFDEVQGDFGITFLLEVSDDRLTDQLRVAHHVEYLVVLPVHQRHL